MYSCASYCRFLCKLDRVFPLYLNSKKRKVKKNSIWSLNITQKVEFLPERLKAKSQGMKPILCLLKLSHHPPNRIPPPALQTEHLCLKFWYSLVCLFYSVNFAFWFYCHFCQYITLLKIFRATSGLSLHKKSDVFSLVVLRQIVILVLFSFL